MTGRKVRPPFTEKGTPGGRPAPQGPFRQGRRQGFLIGLVDFMTAGLFLLAYMPLGGLQDEIDRVLGMRTQRYWKAYLLGIPTLFLYPLVWMGRISEALKEKMRTLGLAGPYPSWRHMVLWNTLGLPLFGPAVATKRFFDALFRTEREMDRRAQLSGEGEASC